MSKILFGADYHLGHENVIDFCNRPYRNLEHMNKSIIENHNSMVKEDDIFYHLGDFSFYGRGWEEKLNGTIIHIAGNHDPNNKTKGLHSGILKKGNLNIFLIHIPPLDLSEVPDNIDCILCGHVHEKWLYKKINGIPIINVGLDVHNYHPVPLKSVFKLHAKILKLKNT